MNWILLRNCRSRSRCLLHRHGSHVLLNVMFGYLAVLVAVDAPVKLAGERELGDAPDAHRVGPGKHLPGKLFITPPTPWVHCNKSRVRDMHVFVIQYKTTR